MEDFVWFAVNGDPDTMISDDGMFEISFADGFGVRVNMGTSDAPDWEPSGPLFPFQWEARGYANELARTMKAEREKVATGPTFPNAWEAEDYANLTAGRTVSFYATGRLEKTLTALGFSTPWDLIGPATTERVAVLNGVRVSFHDSHWNAIKLATAPAFEIGAQVTCELCTTPDVVWTVYDIVRDNSATPARNVYHLETRTGKRRYTRSAYAENLEEA